MKEGFSDSETQAGRLQRCAHKRDACAIECAKHFQCPLTMSPIWRI